MAYKLSYIVNENKVEVIANNEIALAAELLNMERDVGMICYGVSITETKREGETNTLQDLAKIKHYANILDKHLRQQMKKQK
jgi:hypothetical protein